MRKDWLYERRRFLTKVVLREAISHAVNAIFAAHRLDFEVRDLNLCFRLETTRRLDQNLMTEWHICYGDRDVTMY